MRLMLGRSGIYSRGFFCRAIRLAAAITAASIGSSAHSQVTAIWAGQFGSNWDTFSPEWQVIGGSGPSNVYQDGDNVIFDVTSQDTNVPISTNVSPASITVVSTELMGFDFMGSGSINDFGTPGTSLTKLGAGSMTIHSTSTGYTYSSGTEIDQGTLMLYATPNNALFGPLNPHGALVLGGGTLYFSNNSYESGTPGSTTQAFSQTTLNAGASAITVFGDGSGTSTVVNLGFVYRNVGSTVDISQPSSTEVMANYGVINGTNVTGYATMNNGTDWVRSDIGFAFAATYTPDVWGQSGGIYNNTDVQNSSPPTADSTTGSLRFNQAQSFTISLNDTAGNFNTIVSGGILMTPNVGAHNNTISGGLLSPGNGQDLIVIQNDPAGTLTISSTIIDSDFNNVAAVAGLTKSGPGTLILPGENHYSGQTTINAGVLQVSDLGDNVYNSLGGSDQLVMNGGTLRYAGPAEPSSRTFFVTLGAAGGSFDASGTGPINLHAVVAFTSDTPMTFTLTGNNTGPNIFNTGLSDPGTNPATAGEPLNPGHYALALDKEGPGKWVINSNNFYSGGTTINRGTLEVAAGADLGLGPVDVGTGTLAIDGTLNLLSSSLSLENGAVLSLQLDHPGNAANSTIKEGSTLTLNPNLTVLVQAQPNFGAGTYPLIQSYFGFLNVNDQSNNFQGWTMNLAGFIPPANTETYYYFHNNVANASIDLVYGVGIPQLSSGSNTSPVAIPQGANVTLDYYGGPAVQITFNNNGTPTTAGFYYVSPPTGSSTNVTFSYVSGSAPAHAVAPVIEIDPDAITHLIMEDFLPPDSSSDDIFLAALGSGGTWVNAVELDASVGPMADEDYAGSFLSFIQSEFGDGITDPGQLSLAQWSDIDGSWGVDSSVDQAWSVIDYGTGEFTVLDIPAAPEPGVLAMAAGAGLILSRRRILPR
jgi:autotransporter-associated beta strand protein